MSLRTVDTSQRRLMTGHRSCQAVRRSHPPSLSVLGWGQQPFSHLWPSYRLVAIPARPSTMIVTGSRMRLCLLLNKNVKCLLGQEKSLPLLGQGYEIQRQTEPIFLSEKKNYPMNYPWPREKVTLPLTPCNNHLLLRGHVGPSDVWPRNISINLADCNNNQSERRTTLSLTSSLSTFLSLNFGVTLLKKRN